MKRQLIVAGIGIAVAGVLLAGSLAYAGTPANSIVPSIESALLPGIDAVAAELGFTAPAQVNNTNGYTYNPEHEGMNATYTDAQGDALTIEYCSNEFYVATEQTVCYSAPNECGMVGTGFMTRVIATEVRAASSQGACSAVTPSNSLCASADLCPDGSAAPNGDPTQCTCAQGNQNACEAAASGTCPTGQLLQNSVCVDSCGIGYTQQGSSCAFSSCPSGYLQQGTECVASCGLGYAKQGTQCVFSGCPAGYAQQGNACVVSSCTQGAPECGPNGNLYTESASCSLTFLKSCPFGCSNGECLPPEPPSISFTALPSLVQSGQTTKLSWSVTSALSCSITGSNGDGTASSTDSASVGKWTGLSDSVTSSPITGQTVYTILCQAETGAPAPSASQSVTVNIVPNYQEQ